LAGVLALLTTADMSHDKTDCPSCGQRQLTTVSVDGELHISVCGGCDRSYGVDDSMDADFLALLLQDEEFCRDLQISAVTCDQCVNNDVNRFIVVEGPPHLDRLRVMCMECRNFVDIPLRDWETEGPGDDADEAWIAVVLSSMDDNGESLWDSGSVADSEKDHGVEGCAGVDAEPFNCSRCGNSVVDYFRPHFDAASGDLSLVTCLDCGQSTSVRSFFGLECWHCQNDKEELFERQVDDYGRITQLRCFVCDKRLCLPGKMSTRIEAGVEKSPNPRPTFDHLKRHSANVTRGVGLGWTKIEDLRHVERGDHVAWHKWYAIWHHGIVVDIPDGGRALTVIHYNGDITKLDGHFASVRLETIDVDPTKEDVYRVDYPAADRCPVEAVIQRACERLGEAKYNPLTNNCEHFARWCKTGRAECGQVRKFAGRVKLACTSAASKLAHEAAADGLESLVAGSLGKVGLSGVRRRVAEVFGSASGVARNVKCGALACNVAVNVGLEAAVFAADSLVAYRKYRSGAISRDEFRRALGKLGCEDVGGVTGSTAIGILGQLVIPVPFVGGFAGCILGNLIGRYFGAVVGKQVAAVKRRSAAKH